MGKAFRILPKGPDKEQLPPPPSIHTHAHTPTPMVGGGGELTSIAHFDFWDCCYLTCFLQALFMSPGRGGTLGWSLGGCENGGVCISSSITVAAGNGRRLCSARVGLFQQRVHHILNVCVGAAVVVVASWHQALGGGAHCAVLLHKTTDSTWTSCCFV